jgi:hypothetical protein
MGANAENADVGAVGGADPDLPAVGREQQVVGEVPGTQPCDQARMSWVDDDAGRWRGSADDGAEDRDRRGGLSERDPHLLQVGAERQVMRAGADEGSGDDLVIGQPDDGNLSGGVLGHVGVSTVGRHRWNVRVRETVQHRGHVQ